MKTVLVDVDKSGGSSNECALALKHSMKKLTGEETLTVKLAGQMTDSGGGGTLESVAKELKVLGLQNDIYSIGSCTLHLLQLALATPMKKAFGDGGTNNLNVMQLLHSCYNLCNNHETNEIRMIWLDVCQELNIEEAKYRTM